VKSLSLRSRLLAPPASPRFLRNGSRAIAVLLCSASLVALVPTPAPAQSVVERIQLLFTRRREDGRAPGRARGGAIRSACETTAFESDRRLTALIPESNVGKTTAAHPTFWFYVPFTESSPNLVARFTLLNENRETVADNLLVTLPETSGFVRFQWPETEKALDVNEKYYWFFTISCKLPTGTEQDMTDVSGWVERIEVPSELTQQLTASTEVERYPLYAENDIWYEAVTQLAENRTTYLDEWSYLLSQFYLEDLATAPIMELQPSDIAAQ